MIYDKKLAALVKKSLDLYEKDGIIADGKARLLNRYKKEDALLRPLRLPLLQLYSLERK